MNKIVILVFLISVSSSANSQENLDKFVIDTVKGLGSSFILSSSELEKELNSTLSNIESNCCSENFEKKEELLALSKEMKECKNNKCYENIISTLDFRKSDKYLLQQNIEKAEKLLIENTRHRINYAEKNNLELQNNIESIMDAYEKKIAKLEESNKKLQEELTNSKIKKLR
jgi:hypothetical protein